MFKQKSDTASVHVEPADAVQHARTRARQRLIGAVVLLAIGIIGFPLVFETQPRPIPVDIPIDIPRKDSAPPLVMPGAPTSLGQAASPPSVSRAVSALAMASAPSPTTLAGTSRTGSTAVRSTAPDEPASRDEMITESRAEAGREVAAPVIRPASPPATASPATPATPPLAAVKAPQRPSAEAERAQALLEGRPIAAATPPASSPTPATTAADGQRFVVQVGAFAEAEAARETRQRVERLGLKTYTQVAQTTSGSRIRVRVGPFASRPEADAALAKAKGAGIAAVVLSL